MKIIKARFFAPAISCINAARITGTPTSRPPRSDMLASRLLFGLVLYFSALAVQAADHLFQLPDTGNTGHEWLCETTDSRQHGWILRCRDLVAALASDPVLSNGRDSAPSQVIPLYSAPFADSKLDQLASSVLCLGRGDRACRVMIAAH